MCLKTELKNKEPKDNAIKFLERELFGVSQDKSKKKKKNNNQANKFSIDFDDILGLSFFNKYSSFDLAVFSIFVFIVEVSVCSSFFSFEFNYLVFLIPLFYNFLVAILLKFAVYKEIKSFSEFIRLIVTVVPVGLILPFTLVFFLVLIIFVIIFVIIFALIIAINIALRVIIGI
ncbi:MAG: hypothetical protein ACK4GJ_01800 [bacterium]